MRREADGGFLGGEPGEMDLRIKAVRVRGGNLKKIKESQNCRDHILF